MIMLSVVIVMILRECYIFSVDTLYTVQYSYDKARFCELNTETIRL